MRWGAIPEARYDRSNSNSSSRPAASTINHGPLQGSGFDEANQNPTTALQVSPCHGPEPIWRRLPSDESPAVSAAPKVRCLADLLGTPQSALSRRVLRRVDLVDPPECRLRLFLAPQAQ